MPIEAVVFDIGNVLVEWHPTRPFDRLLGRERRETLFTQVDFAGMNDRVDLGADFETEVAALADKHADIRDEVMIWQKHWLEMLSPALPRSARMLRALRAKGMPVFALSNFGTPTLEIADAEYPALLDFDKRYVSGHLGLMKPDPAIYEVVETDTGIAPQSLFFIDDRADNIAAAKARGWQGHLFESEAGLAEALVALGLLSIDQAA